ncbi:hypothetical protein JOC86_002407 [Bacillus pakistanensis]|uniref:Uncharacterized protein n=1 Tax=Rossellomorea pakistanensis TaxID=992288 RepID=A0ABS2NDI3_9BACI|nr:hypothetical protein [Bacillus pakistanensis]MBM7585865.1 hypothetical protein [Bacillus pakistanensis]
MIFEIVITTLMGSLALKAHLSKNGLGNDSKKLNKIFSLSGLNVKDGDQTLTTQLKKKKNYDPLVQKNSYLLPNYQIIPKR